MSPTRARAAEWALLPALVLAFWIAIRWADAPRPFLDAYTPPQPYRWVSPPPEFAQHNQPPAKGETTIAFTRGRSDPASAFTDDGQVTVSFNPSAFPPLAGQTGVRVTITPVQPQPPTPEGVITDGNAYTIAAVYVPGGQPLSALTEPALVDLRYPGQRPDAIYRIEGTTWTPIGGTVQELLLTIDTRSMQLGTFIAGHRPPTPAPAASGSSRLYGALLAVVLLAGVLVLLLMAGGLRIRFRPERRPRDRRRPRR